jgi:hypothetical protein
VERVVEQGKRTGDWIYDHHLDWDEPVATGA